MNTQEISSIQADFDSKYREHNEPGEKLQHITLHAGKLLGKICSYSEAVEHGQRPSTKQLISEVIPDLIVYASQLANLLEIELGECDLDKDEYTDLVEEEVNPSILRVTKQLGEDIGMLFYLLNSFEYRNGLFVNKHIESEAIDTDGDDGNEEFMEVINEIIYSFYSHAIELAYLLGQNPEDLYRKKIESNISRHESQKNNG